MEITITASKLVRRVQAYASKRKVEVAAAVEELLDRALDDIDARTLGGKVAQSHMTDTERKQSAAHAAKSRWANRKEPTSEE